MWVWQEDPKPFRGLIKLMQEDDGDLDYLFPSIIPTNPLACDVYVANRLDKFRAEDDIQCFRLYIDHPDAPYVCNAVASVITYCYGYQIPLTICTLMSDGEYVEKIIIPK